MINNTVASQVCSLHTLSDLELLQLYRKRLCVAGKMRDRLCSQAESDFLSSEPDAKQHFSIATFSLNQELLDYSAEFLVPLENQIHKRRLEHVLIRARQQTSDRERFLNEEISAMYSAAISELVWEALGGLAIYCFFSVMS